MKAAELLSNLNQLDWRTLFVGWRRAWVTPSDLIGYAVAWLLAHPVESDSRIIELAGGESLEDSELDSLLASYVLAATASLPNEMASPEVDKWRFAHLRLLADAELDPETKLDRLEQVYAEFGYPEDMAACSRYYVAPSQQQHGWAVGDQCPSPLDAMEAVLKELSYKLGVTEGV